LVLLAPVFPLPTSAGWTYLLQIKRLDMEARSLAPEKSRGLLNKVKEYKADLQSLKEQLRQSAAGLSDSDAARAELGLGDSYYSTSAGQRERMLAATERMQKTSDRLQVGKQQLAETEVRVTCSWATCNGDLLL
jgi:vesicle transport through interaction with t-SNAREs protein 1